MLVRYYSVLYDAKRSGFWKVPKVSYVNEHEKKERVCKVTNKTTRIQHWSRIDHPLFGEDWSHELDDSSINTKHLNRSLYWPLCALKHPLSVPARDKGVFVVVCNKSTAPGILSRKNK